MIWVYSFSLLKLPQLWKLFRLNFRAVQFFVEFQKYHLITADCILHQLHQLQKQLMLYVDYSAALLNSYSRLKTPLTGRKQ